MQGSVGSGGKVNDEDVDGLGFGECVCVDDDDGDEPADDDEPGTEDDVIGNDELELPGIVGG